MQLTAFALRVLAVVRGIPRGAVMTYGDVAACAGRPGAARSVGTILKLHGGGRAPCHRVIGANGALGGFGGHESQKRALLLAEGVPIRGRRVLPRGYVDRRPEAATTSHPRSNKGTRYNRTS